MEGEETALTLLRIDLTYALFIKLFLKKYSINSYFFLSFFKRWKMCWGFIAVCLFSILRLLSLSPWYALVWNVLASKGCHSKIMQNGYLEQQKFMFLQFRSLSVQDQHARQFGFSWDLSLGLHKVTFWGCPHKACTVYTCIIGASLSVLVSSSYKDTSQIGLRSTLMI